MHTSSSDPFSLLLIVKGREAHIKNLLASLEASTLAPDEIVIAHMNQAAQEYQSRFTIKQIVIESDRPLPLARARNAAAAAARCENLIFLDVDCIPAPDCFEVLLADLRHYDLNMVDPQYLRTAIDDPLDFENMSAQARRNPARDALAFGRSNRYEMFWSLGFSISKQNFSKIGGFDERYVGYGGEDTDFAFSARDAGVSLNYSQAVVYHQNHKSYDPPLNWLQDIVINASVFHEKWGVWPMDGWLNGFASQGYITFGRDALTIKRLPTEDEIAACLKADAL